MDCWLNPQRKLDIRNKQYKSTGHCIYKKPKVIVKQCTSLKIAYFLCQGLCLLFVLCVCHSLLLFSVSNKSASSPVDGTVSSDSCYTILTTTVPRYACWLVCVGPNVENITDILRNLTDLCLICEINIEFSLTFFSLSFRCFQMEPDVKQSEQAQQLTKVGLEASARSTTCLLACVRQYLF